MIKVNGQELETVNEISLEEFLINKGYLVERVVVELNGDIIPKAQFNQTNIKDGDSLEVISFVGGG
ncbi:sulfur carrier protein ThiS [Clostridium chromiireducens]|uniref:Sulfur carrier protein ThiS n=1 Tax=Clostridium chromiireducens TaxID=225345 RepID=A0A1V4J1A8_9CLOT|nr:sulfur carrier protein ThiS [Clostridium chromiireducens]OPJ65437.1 sulfur carrier protein ThiS [Clostridium chromiireducens]RII35855.1 sulfur carrier protein ThiS [Clostridium chromiireducens]